MQRLERLSAQADPVGRSRQFRAQQQRGAGRRSGGGLSRSLISSLFLLLGRVVVALRVSMVVPPMDRGRAAHTVTSELGSTSSSSSSSSLDSLHSLLHGSSSGGELSLKTSSSLFQFPPLNLDLHSLFDHNDDTTQLDGKLHLGGTGLRGTGSSLSTGGTSGLGSSSLLDSQLKSNAASEAADDSTSTQGVAGGGGGSEGSKGGTPHWVEWLKTGTDVSINLAAWRPEAGVTIESLKSGKVPSSSLQTFKFEDDRGAAGGAAGEEAEREVQLEAEFVSALPETDWQPHFKTCAVVGNSGTLLGKGFGAQIDAHDAVMRINYAPTKGFEKDVGRTTTMDLCNKENTGFLTSGKHRWRNSTLLLFEAHSRIIRKNVYHKLLLSKPVEQKVVMLNPAMVTMSRTIFNHIKSELETDVRAALAGRETDPAKLRYAQELHKANLASTPAGSADATKETFAFHGKPMSGITAAYTAMQLCESVDMYGFDAYTASTSTPYHYFDQRAAMTSVHSFDLAMEVYRRLGLHAPVTVHS